MSDFRARAEKVQNEPGTFYCAREEISKSVGYGLEGYKSHLKGSYWPDLSLCQNNDRKLTS